MRSVEVFDHDKWVDVPLTKLTPGDLFLLDGEQNTAKAKPYQGKAGKWNIPGNLYLRSQLNWL